MTKLFADQLDEKWDEKLTNWNRVNMIRLKYDLPVPSRGYGAIEIASLILKAHKDKLDRREIKFLERICHVKDS